MKKNRTVLCVDIGTSSLKVAAISSAGNVICKVRKEIKDHEKTQSVSGKWLESYEEARGEILAFLGDPAFFFDAVCISGNGPSLVYADEKKIFQNTDELKNCPTLLWNDKISFKAEEKIKETENRLLKTNFKNTFSIYLPRIIAFKEMFPYSFSEKGMLLSGPEWLTFALTKKAFTFLPEERFKNAYWTEELLLAAGFEKDEIKKLPPFTLSGNIIGKDSYGSPLVAGLPDFLAAMLGTSSVTEGSLFLRSGTSEGLNLCTKNPLRGEGIRTLPSPVKGLWNAGVLFQDTKESPSSASSLEKFARGYKCLMEKAEEEAIPFSSTIKVCGGQANNLELMKKKEEELKKINPDANLVPCRESDAELLGDAALAFKALGDFSDIKEASLFLGEKS